jgi:hypothetical protein
MKYVTEEQQKMLEKPIDDKYLSTRYDGMTSIKSIAVTMRLNKIFGYGSWQIRVEDMHSKQITVLVKDKKKEGEMKEKLVWYSTCKVILDIPEYGMHYECCAGTQHDEEGDSRKGSITDGLTKIASWMGIGWEIYAGK